MFLAIALATAPAHARPAPLTDSDIRNAVDDELIDDPAVAAAAIDTRNPRSIALHAIRG